MNNNTFLNKLGKLLKTDQYVTSKQSHCLLSTADLVGKKINNTLTYFYAMSLTSYPA